MCDPTDEVIIYLSMNSDDGTDIPTTQSDSNDIYSQDQRNKDYSDSKISDVEESVCSKNSMRSSIRPSSMNTHYAKHPSRINFNTEKKLEIFPKNLAFNYYLNDQAITYGSYLNHNSYMKNSKDHNYSDMSRSEKADNFSNTIKKDDSYILHGDVASIANRNISSLTSKDDKSLCKIKNINDLKKVLPKVKLLSNQINTLNDLSKTQCFQKSADKYTASDVMNYKDKLKNYCRTCAGLKIPLVDIFSEKGIQMRLSQQMNHLENINEHDSLSTQMCMDCICDLKMSYKFFMQIKKAQVKLKSIYASSSSSLLHAKQQCIVPTLNFGSSEKLLQEKADKSNIYINKTSKQQLLALNINDENLVHPDNSTQSKQLCEHTQHNNGYDSIEEFDPDDPQIESEIIESDVMETDEDNWKNIENDENLLNKRNTCTVKLSEKSNESLLDVDAGDTTIYQYDTELDTYIKLESSEEVTKLNNICHIDSSQLYLVLPKITNDTEDFQNANNVCKENSKHPSILKRKISMCDKLANSSTNILQNNNELPVMKEQKIHKLNTLNVSPSNEQGIMYVTVKGSKPNELLLVKVKKMDKLDEKKDENNLHKKVVEVKNIERSSGLKNLSIKDIYNVRSKELENRGAIIEEQIEEYKKKREKILGGISNSTSSNITNNSSVETKTPENHQQLQKMIDSNKKNSSNEEWVFPEDMNDQSDNDVLHHLYNNANKEKEQENTREYLNRLAIIRQISEQERIKKISFQKEFNQPYSEESIDKLSRILGEKEKNLQDFQEYLKQRKILIARLKDKDIVSLYENRINDTDLGNITTIVQKNLLDLIDEIDSTQVNFFDCDYCSDIFNTREALEEHLKLHDYKIFYFCEDCGCEFSTNKAKRSHSITCLKKLICNYCNLMLESKGKKRQHEQKHCDAIYGQLCDVCGEKFKHQGTLDQHIKTQHMSWEKIFQCPKCPKKFAFKQKLTFHVKSVHTTLRAYLCEDCGADFKNPASLRHHRIRKHQPASNKRECQVCHKLVPFYSLSKHMYTHKAYTIQCPHCDKMFKNSSTLKQHLRIHEDQRQYRCDTCGVGFNRRDGLRLHMRVHQKSDSRALKECSCQICSEKFPNHSMLVIHRNRVHKDGKQYTCHICNRSMLSTRSLEWHMSHIHNEIPAGIVEEQTDVIEKKRVSCNYCNKTFKTEMILRTHIKNTHMEKNPVKCSDCDLMFTSEVRLRHHMMIAHNRLEGTLTCPHCPKRFVNQLRLKTHMISHSEERPYTCEICGFNLKTKIQLIKHHQNRHSDERPLQCRYCPWRCKQVSALVCHERTHTNERPYSCIVCKQRFKYLGDKNKHERRHESLGGSGFKRIVAGRNIKNIQNNSHDVGETTSVSDQEQMELQEGEYDTNAETELTVEQHYEMEPSEEYENKYATENQEIIKFETTQEHIKEDYDRTTDYEQQEFEETSREASDAAEVIMSIEDTTVYTEEVTADNIEHAEMITEQMMSNQILQTGTVVHLHQQDDHGKIQVIPVMLSLPDLTDDSTTEVNLTSASIVYNS